MMRSKLSRPLLSVPKKWVMVGAFRRLYKSPLLAACSGTMIEPRTMNNTMMMVPTAPITAMRCLRKRRQINWPGVRGLSVEVDSDCRTGTNFVRSASVAINAPSAQTDARVYEGVQDVHDNGKEDHRGADDQQDAVHDRKIAALGVFPEEAPHPRPGENGLGHDGPSQQEGDIQADDGDEGQHGIAQGMPDECGAFPQALGAGRAHVVQPEHLQDAGAQEAGISGHLNDDQAGDRQDHMISECPQIMGIPDVRPGGQIWQMPGLELDGKDIHEAQ